MKLYGLFFILLLGFVSLTCNLPSETSVPSNNDSKNRLAKIQYHATGSVEIVTSADKGNSNIERLMFADFDAHEASLNKSAKGTFIFRVLNMDSTLHREITADFFDVYIDQIEKKGWFVGKVISDTKGCSGNGNGDHEIGCIGNDADGDGCSGDGCENCGDEQHSDGCTGSESEHDSSCAGGGGENQSGGCEEGSNSGENCSGGGNNQYNVNGKYCRTGQYIAVKIHDVSTPGSIGDGITWKWFAPNNPIVEILKTENIASWPHLCKKIIIEGNLVIHD